MDPTESGVIESSGGGPDRIESNSGGPDIIGSGPDRTGSDHDGPDKSVIIPKKINFCHTYGCLLL